MASPRSSAASDASSSPPSTPLTPRSKIKALFATVDGSSDSEGVSMAKKTAEQGSTAVPSTAAPTHVDAEETTDDEAVVRPRGRLAARMQTEDARRPDAISESDSEPRGDARERVRRMLLQPSVPETSAVETEDANMDEDDEDDEDDEVVVSRPGRFRNKLHRSKTPEATPPPREDTEKSPGMFVTPHKDTPALPQPAEAGSDSDSDIPAVDITKGSRFQQLIAQKRAQRLAKEADDARKQAAREAAREHEPAEDSFIVGDDADDSNISDDEGGRRLTQDGRPAARKASKKALEEMNRETQRMTRNLQLAHEAKTRKKISKASLFERFNFRPQGLGIEDRVSSSSPVTPKSALHTDTEMKDAETPPSSPPVLDKAQTPAKLPSISRIEAQSGLESLIRGDDSEEELPTRAEVMATASQKKLDKGKGKATAADLAELQEKKPAALRRVRVKLPIHANLATAESEDELVIMTTRKSRMDAIFDRVPASKEKESRSMLALRQLAQLKSPGKAAKQKKGKNSLTAAELQVNLQQRARQQAKVEREQRLEFLKSKGVHIETAAEREQAMAEVEDIVSRARQEAEEIMQREREVAKQEKREKIKNGEIDPLAWDDSDDSDDEYEEKEEPQEIELSGSEDSGAEDGDAEAEASEKESAAGDLIDDEADSTGESQDEQEVEAAENDLPAPVSDDEMMGLPTTKPRRAKNHVTIISDDEDEDEEDILVAKTPNPKANLFKSPSALQNSDSPQVPTSVLRSATKVFIPGLPVVAGGPAGLGLTQIFAGTMDDSQAGTACSPTQPMPTFENPQNLSQNVMEDADEMILDSQPTEGATTQVNEDESQGVQLHFSQSEVHGLDSLIPDDDLIEPTQDGGYHNYTPLRERFIEAPPSTVQTVRVDPTQPVASQYDSPLLQKGRKLRRRTAAPLDSDDEADVGAIVEPVMEDADQAENPSAFNVMKDAAAKEQKRKAMEDFNKKKSKAKEMVEEQAEESEDEYAGLGGADGEDSDDDSAASVHEMIDDDHKNTSVDKAKLAAFFADRERASDEKQVEKLFRDLTSGMLRRKRGADYDLSDSDDGGEARRRMKRRQFAKMQKALFADERISKVAENPRNQAFLRTIEDHGSDDDTDFLFATPPPGPAAEPSAESSQAASQDAAATVPDSQPGRTAAAATATGARPPAPQRRTRDGRKPANLGEVRATLSSLFEGTANESVIPATLVEASDSDADEEDNNNSNNHGTSRRRLASRSPNKENRSPGRRRGRQPVVDRISLKRAGSSSTSVSSAASGGSGGRLAFAAPGPGGQGAGAFKVPALLRRATTNSLMSTASSTASSGNGGGGSGSGAGSAASAGGFGDEAKIKRAAGKRSGVNYFARENERRAALAESERRREARKWRGAEGRGRVVGGLFGAGKFE